ncbi:MAG: histidine kinase [Cytophagales bacterium]
MAKKNRDTLTLIKAYLNHAINYCVQGNYSLETKFLTMLFSLSKNSKDLEKQGYYFLAKGFNEDFSDGGDSVYFNRTFQDFKLAISNFSKFKNYLGLGDAYYSLALSLVHLADRPQKTLFYGPEKKYLNPYVQKLNPKSILKEAYLNINEAQSFYVLAKMNDRVAACIAEKARVHIYMKEYHRALDLLNTAIKIHRFENGLIGEGKCLMLMSDIYAVQNQHTIAIKYAKMALEKYQISNYNLEIALVLKKIALVYEKLSNYKIAMNYYNQAHQYQDLSYNENSINTNLEIQNNYENQLKNAAILELQSENKIRILEKQQTIYFILIGIIIFMVLLSIALILYWLKVKSLKHTQKNLELTTLLNTSLQMKVHDAELTAMRAEMDPHFIFNVMNSIQGLIVTNKQNEAIQYLNEFSKLSRRILNQSSIKYINLDDEIAFLKNYLILESMRFEDKFSVNWNIQDNLEQDNIHIPPMIIQPFLENSIKHGLLPKHGEKKIDLKIFSKEDNLLTVEITDNGVGRNHKKEAFFKNESKGLKITQKRFQYLNSKESENQLYSFEIFDLKDINNLPSGTKVVINFPFDTNY